MATSFPYLCSRGAAARALYWTRLVPAAIHGQDGGILFAAHETPVSNASSSGIASTDRRVASRTSGRQANRCSRRARSTDALLIAQPRSSELEHSRAVSNSALA